ncbi:GNAT family N-acetyltransferase [Myceligenerans xiligouense]|uniref:Acetyltransferase (GNAT) family protein n=1 Tax=Myceligenerans xiligouense TaxID=253184 RepID=A0A3N4Z7I3_9MICO|nr:GNAT family N-acetyltransferase [Myceligenerans xiligouense]RPF21272.1 acetyltransferase (GNAT) family protein [Myceligenerans xiligouense]
MQLSSPATRDDAITLVQSHSPTFPVPGQRELFADFSLNRLFDRGVRRPDLVWAVEPSGPGDDGGARGLVAARHLSDAEGLVDLFALPGNPAVVDLLLGAATDWARSHGGVVEASFSAPAAPDPLAVPAVRGLVDAFARHGWKVLVTRRHYHFAARDGMADGVAPLDLEPARDRERVEAFVRQMMPGSLDVRDRANVAAKGLERAAADETDDLLGADPIECFGFAVQDGQDAGLVVRRALPNGNGLICQVGVAESFRGRGLARRLVATATADLLAEGSTTLIADTDDTNVPMIRAFAAAGWVPTESRIDLTLG